jgi:hypothetical protein
VSGLFEADSKEVLHAASRMRILTALYPHLPICFLKAKVAYALGHFASADDNYALAEKLFFESLYILDLCKPFTEGLPSILSELGTNAAVAYAEVLLRNYKYQYAILSFEVALANFFFRGKEKEYQSLLRKVANHCRDNDDLSRCVTLFREILYAYCWDNKINEVVFVSETLCTFHQERGEFGIAEAYLLLATLALRKNNSSQADRLLADPLYFRLLFQLAHMYLESFQFEKGIELMEWLNRGDLPFSKRNQLLTDLAKAYIKKEWFKECESVLALLEGDERAHGRIPLSIF